VKSNSNQIDLSKKEIFEKESVKIIDTKNSLNQKDVSSQKIENNITDVNKELKTDSNELKNEPKKTQTEEITKTVVNSEEAVKSVVLEDAKKISVKVKGGVKTVTNTTESGNAIKTESSSENKTESDSNNSDESTKKSASSILSATEKILQKTEHPQNFENILKDEVKKEVTLNQKVNIENEIDKNQRFVKSSEIIKELSKFITRQEKGSLSFDIKPESLGKMKITLDTIDHAVKASIEVDNEQAKQLVERNINKLQQELQSNGIQLSSLNISLGQPKNHKSEKQTSGSNKNNDSNFENDEIEITEEKKKTLGYNTYEYIA
ncbi:MAG: flagellar hook-length control protein FliK, partial [Ignavibacteriae bacterium]|nr:flagellar hook-length control protein FliK [Ignavibacteriota bacterium]